MGKTVLVTGIDGFVAKHCAVRFLDAGYEVRGSVLDPGWADDVRRTLAAHADVSKLDFVTADLLTDTGWDAAADGCEIIAHVASPDPIAQPRNPEDLVRPAVDGTLRVLRAAHAGGVRRVVHTSSIFATYFGRTDHTGVFDASDWSDLDGPGITPYARWKFWPRGPHVSSSPRRPGPSTYRWYPDTYLARPSTPTYAHPSR